MEITFFSIRWKEYVSLTIRLSVVPILRYLYQATQQIMQIKLKSVESCHNLIINWKFLQITTNKNDVSIHRLE